MRASAYSLVSLSQFARILGLDPMHFAGGYSSERPAAAHCHDVWMQYQWQSAGKASREEVARALLRAEEEIADLCGYYAAWKWIADERHKLDRGGFVPNLSRTRLVTKRGYVLGGGAQATSDIDAADVTKGADLDTDGDGFAETAVFTIVDVDTTWGLEEIRACFKEYDGTVNCRTDPSSEGYDEAWEVRPLKLARSGTTVTAYIPVWHLFRPQLQEELDASNINADLAASYVDTLSFYRVYNDLSSQVSFMWGTDCVYDVSCAWAVQPGCIRTPNPRTGTITIVPGTWDADCNCYDATSYTYATVPDAVRLWYRAGLARPAPGMVDHRMARLIVILACARLDYPICSCGNPQTLVADWRENAARANKERSFMLTPQMLSNVLGTRVGEIMVWSALNVPSIRIGKAVKT